MRVINLPSAFRRRAEAFFGQPLRDVSLLRPAPADKGVPPGLAGCLDAETIWLRTPGDPTDPRLAPVLIHELCHVVQKRAGARKGRAAPRDRLEAQAHAAARLFAAGAPSPPPLPDASRRTLHWGPQGHYYTVYYCALAAAIEPNLASEYAFYAQMADQVMELDAKEAGIDHRVRDLQDYKRQRWKDMQDEWARWKGTYRPGWRQTEERVINNIARERDIMVEMGLHSLTGRASEKETSVRLDIAINALDNSFVCGLALHAFGDCFAHRRMSDETHLYLAPDGHGTEISIGTIPLSPDRIHNRRNLYQRYGIALFHLFKKQSGDSTTITSNLIADLDTVSALDDEGAQIERLRSMAQGLVKVPIKSYRPESEGMRTWAEFVRAHAPLPGPGGTLDQAYLLARKWMTASLD